MWGNTENPRPDRNEDDSDGYSTGLADLAFFAAIGLSCCTLGLVVWALVS